MKFIKRSSGQSAVASAAYRSGKKLTDERSGEVHDYTKRKGVESAFIIAPDGAPSWVADRGALWNAVEQRETHVRAQPAREFLLTLPAELSPAAGRDAVIEFVATHLTPKGIVADVAIHRDPKNRNPHAHVLSTVRPLGPEGWSKTKIREFKPELEGVYRPAWEAICNRQLEREGHQVRVDHRSKIEQYRDAYYLDPTNVPDHLKLAPQAKRGARVDRLIAKGEIEHPIVQGYYNRQHRAEVTWGVEKRDAELEVVAEHFTTFAQQILSAVEIQDRQELQRLAEITDMNRRAIEQAEPPNGSPTHMMAGVFGELTEFATEFQRDLSISQGRADFERVRALESMLETGKTVAPDTPAATPRLDHLGRSPEQVERDRQRLLGRDGPSLGR